MVVSQPGFGGQHGPDYPNDGSIAKITLHVDGPITKSPLYQDSEGIDTELFLSFNRELLLRHANEKLLSYFSPLDLSSMADSESKYFLMGRDAFYSVDDSKESGEDMEAKKKDLEEKLKGF